MIRRARSGAGCGYGADVIFFWVMAAERPVLPDEKSGLHVCFSNRPVWSQALSDYPRQQL
jgi:hypothetical protein